MPGESQRNEENIPHFFRSMLTAMGVTRMDKIRIENIRGTAQVGKFGEKTREARLRWYGHLRRKDDGYTAAGEQGPNQIM